MSRTKRLAEVRSTEVPGVRSASRAVPAVVPSLVYSSRPVVDVAAGVAAGFVTN